MKPISIAAVAAVVLMFAVAGAVRSSRPAGYDAWFEKKERIEAACAENLSKTTAASARQIVRESCNDLRAEIDAQQPR